MHHSSTAALYGAQAGNGTLHCCTDMTCRQNSSRVVACGIASFRKETLLVYDPIIEGVDRCERSISIEDYVHHVVHGVDFHDDLLGQRSRFSSV